MPTNPYLDKGFLQGIPVETTGSLEGPRVADKEGIDKIPHSFITKRTAQVPHQKEEAVQRGWESYWDCQSRGVNGVCYRTLVVVSCFNNYYIN